MFGFLMGTLQKFKENEDEAKKSDKVQHFFKRSTEVRISCKYFVATCFVQERRRAEIEGKLEQKHEIEKEAAMQARKDLFQELKSNKTKIARLSFQMSTIRMVRSLSLSLSLSLVPWLLCARVHLVSLLL